MGARSKAISKRRSASRPARSAPRWSVTSRETKTIPSMLPSCARTGALCTTMVRREIGPNVSTLALLPGQRAGEDRLGGGEQLGGNDLR